MNNKKRVFFLVNVLFDLIILGLAVFLYKDQLFPINTPKQAAPTGVTVRIDGPTYETINDLVKDSKYVFIANTTKFISTTGELVDKIPTGVESHYEAAVERVLLGNTKSKNVILSTIGGDYKGITYTSLEGQDIKVGKRYIVFAVDSSDDVNFTPTLASELKDDNTFVVSGYPMITTKEGKVFNLSEVELAVK